MARIRDAQKVEVLRTFSIEEYNVRLDFRMNHDGDGGSINVFITDPRTQERAEIRAWIEQNLESEDDSFARMNLLTMLDERDEKSLEKWGTNKGEPSPYCVTLWFDNKIADVLKNFFSGEELTASVNETIRDSFAKTNDRGF